MKLNQKHLIIIGAVLFGVLIVCLILITGIGNAYKSGLSRFTDNNTPANTTLIEREKITRITLKNGKDKGCIEVTPDGAVRIYDICGEQLSDANRISDTTNITRLFKQVSELNLKNITGTNECSTYIINVETASGQKNFCLTDLKNAGTQNGNPNQNNQQVIDRIITDIKQTIDDIITEIPKPTPTSAAVPTQPDIIPTIPPVQTLAPSQILPPFVSPTAIPEPTGGTFTCDFDTSGKTGKPYRVSNVVCTSLPEAVK
jgi:hypothetical protein